MLLRQTNRVEPAGVTRSGDEAVTAHPRRLIGGTDKMTALLTQCVAPSPLFQKAQDINGAELTVTGNLYCGACWYQAVHISQEGTLFLG